MLHKVYGLVVVGSKGQIVIPVQARKDLKIRSGDSLLVMGKMGKILGMVKAEQLDEIVRMIMAEIEGLVSSKQRTVFKKQAKEMLKYLGKKKS